MALNIYNTVFIIGFLDVATNSLARLSARLVHLEVAPLLSHFVRPEVRFVLARCHHLGMWFAKTRGKVCAAASCCMIDKSREWSLVVRVYPMT
jgi:hypothetical protein